MNSFSRGEVLSYIKSQNGNPVKIQDVKAALTNVRINNTEIELTILGALRNGTLELTDKGVRWV